MAKKTTKRTPAAERKTEPKLVVNFLWEDAEGNWGFDRVIAHGYSAIETLGDIAVIEDRVVKEKGYAKVRIQNFFPVMGYVETPVSAATDMQKLVDQAEAELEG